MTTHDRFGSGIYLNPTYDDYEEPEGYPWDLGVDDTGDLRMTYGEQELLKDVAFRASSELQDIMGGPMGQGIIDDIEDVVRRILREEPRVDSIVEVDASQSSMGYIHVDATAMAESEQVDLIFEVD